MSFDLMLTGDVIMNRPVRSYRDGRFHSLAALLRQADCSIAHFESVIHNYKGSEVYPAAEGGWTWMRSPRLVADELRWMGIDGVTLAHNHSLDYSYGGLKETIETFDAIGMEHAGAGNDLSEASAPAYIERGSRVAFIGMTSSYQQWGRAGEARNDMPGRPGVNPLRFNYAGSREVIQPALDLAKAMGHWVIQVDDGEWWTHPSGLHNNLTKYRLNDSDHLTTVVDASDLARHRTVVQEARVRSDLVVVQVHNHEWDPIRGLHVPPAFMRQFAHEMIDAGADVVLAEGTHAPLRGIEIYNGRVIFYDPGDFIRQTGTVSKLPHEFYLRHEHELTNPPTTATPTEAWKARNTERYQKPEYPVGGYRTAPLLGGFLPVCRFADDGTLELIQLHPFIGSRDGFTAGMPLAADELETNAVLDHVQDLSNEFNTTIENINGIGTIHPTPNGRRLQGQP